MQNKHGPNEGLLLGMQSNRGSPVTGGKSPPAIRVGKLSLRRHASARPREHPDYAYPFTIVVKPPGQGFMTLKKRSRYDIVYGLREE